MMVLNHITAFAERARRIAMLSDAPFYSVRLVDRRTGETHRIEGAPLTVVTSDPVTASSQLLRNRDPELWDAFVEQLDHKGILQ